MSGVFAAGAGLAVASKVGGGILAGKNKTETKIEDTNSAKLGRNILGPDVIGGMTQNGNAFNKGVEPKQTGIADAFLAGKTGGEEATQAQIIDQIATQNAALAAKKAPSVVRNEAITKAFGGVSGEESKQFTNKALGFLARSNPNAKSTTTQAPVNWVGVAEGATTDVLKGGVASAQGQYMDAMKAAQLNQATLDEMDYKRALRTPLTDPSKVYTPPTT